VHRDARLFVAKLEANKRVVHEIERGRGLWLHLARGIVTVNGAEMREGDAAAVEDEPAIAIETDADAESLLFELG
jgi:redox-sensitive bicupin YhaK (pirin superfamily)